MPQPAVAGFARPPLKLTLEDWTVDLTLDFALELTLGLALGLRRGGREGLERWHFLDVEVGLQGDGTAPVVHTPLVQVHSALCAGSPAERHQSTAQRSTAIEVKMLHVHCSTVMQSTVLYSATQQSTVQGWFTPRSLSPHLASLYLVTVSHRREHRQRKEKMCTWNSRFSMTTPVLPGARGRPLAHQA